MSSKNDWSFSKKFTFSLIAIILFILFLESGTFLYTKIKSVTLIRTHKMPAWMGDVGSDVLNAYSALDNKMMAYSQMRFIPLKDTSVIRINSLGFRGKEFSTTKDKNTYRIIILGGSAANGKGASSNDTTIAGYLEKILTEKIKGRSFEVYNMAIFGYISAQELITLQFHGLDFKPDLVIDINGYNDLITGMHDADYPAYASADTEPVIQAYNTLWKGHFSSIALIVLKRWSYFIRHLSAKMEVEYKKRYIATPSVREKLITGRIPRIDFYIKNMNTMYALSEYYKYNLVVVLQPTLIQKSPLTEKEEKIKQSYFVSGDCKELFPYVLSTYYPIISERMGELKNNKQHFFLDFSQLFINIKEQAFVDIVHYSDKGNKIFAERLYDKILPVINEKIQ